MKLSYFSLSWFLCFMILDWRMLQCNRYNAAGVTSGLVVIFYGVTSVVGEVIKVKWISNVDLLHCGSSKLSEFCNSSGVVKKREREKIWCSWSTAARQMKRRLWRSFPVMSWRALQFLRFFCFFFMNSGWYIMEPRKCLLPSLFEDELLNHNYPF